MTGSLQTKKGKYYAVYRDDNGKQRWVPLNLPVEGNNKRKALKKLQEVLAEAEKNKAVVTGKFIIGRRRGYQNHSGISGAQSGVYNDQYISALYCPWWTRHRKFHEPNHCMKIL